MDKVKVAIRVRPFNRREIELCTKCVVEMRESQTILHHHSSTEKGTESSRKQPKVFAFDNSFWSFCEEDDHFQSQASVYKSLGVDILDNAFQGYNACIFAYGQTGSGKSYTMMGSHEDMGIIPRLCDNLFERIEACNEDANISYKVEVSYMEIYNEKVHDLLDPKGTKQHLRVREHNLLGPYVDGLSILAVSSFKDIDNLMQEGNKSRTVAATNMNNESSRSHAVFNVILTQTLVDVASGVTGEKVSKISLVDLAGSERAVKTGAVGERLKEGSNINKSLTTLGLVISKLADQSSSRGAIKDKFVPYRDSVLTWLLKDNLGGNSRTVMVATISPAADNYEESLSTLRYADRAKRIVNHAVVNEDPNARIIRELRQEVEVLKEQLKHATTATPTSFLQQREGLTEKLLESEKLMKQMSQTWEEKLRNTEKIHQERQQALEKMGISVQASGIKVENNKYYLVNLNADPSLNELLVYYLKEHTLVGGPDASVKNDIQLSGLGIMPEHCIITLENTDLFIKPVEGARTCVNGSNVQEKTLLRHGDRVLWGNNHFFRVNCPKANAPLSDCEAPGRPIDYEFAREELMMNELSNDPIQSAMKALERQHEEDKQGALEKQRKMYERQLLMLRNQMSPTTPYAPYVAFDPLGFMRNTPSTPTFQSKVEKWAQERIPQNMHGYLSTYACYSFSPFEDELFKKSLAKLREDIVKANSLVREASSLAEEMGKHTEFGVTLQIPAANLSPNRKRGSFVSEPAILVKRKNKPNQVWTMDKLEMKLIDMREMYSERRDKGLPMKDDSPPRSSDPFYESQENHNLIGVANVFLEVLFHDVTLNYHVPIISQQGEVAGRLQVEISRISGQIPDRVNDTSSEGSADSTITNGTDSSEDSLSSPNQIACRVVIKQATGLPPSLSNFVFCQYHFWGYPETTVVPPVVHPERNAEHVTNNSMTFSFDHTKDFIVNITEEFVEHCTEGALSIEVWGHRSSGFGSTNPGWELDSQLICSRSLADRWSELTRKIELRVEIHELNDQGEYSPVEVAAKADVLTGGIFQLRQGQQRRVLVRVQPVQNSGTLPIICESINTIAIGSVCARHKLQKGLDSYQEEDLSLLREKWSDALLRRRQYLDDNIQRIINKIGKTDQDVEREQSLIDQWVCLTEERNAVLVPAPKSGIPGAPADWDPSLGMERHIPVLFLDLNADDMSTTSSGDGNPVAGAKSILPKEQNGHLFNLQIVKLFDKDVCAVAGWDSSIHDSIHLNRVTPADERVYLILKATVRLSHPATMQLVLRKRLCINVYKRQSLTEKLRRKINRQEALTVCSVTYEVVSNIPKASEELEDRESLAQIAASGAEGNASDGESYIEKYTRGVSAVESILTLDRLRQDVAVKELLAARGTPLRKTASVPNISNMMRMDASPSKLEDQQWYSESMTDVSPESLNKLLLRQRSNSLNSNKAGSPDSKSQAGNSFGLTRPTFLNLSFSLNSLRTQTTNNKYPSAASPQPTKLIKPMRTLMEEQYHREVTPLLNNEGSRQRQVGEEAEYHLKNSQEAETLNVRLEKRHQDCDEEEFSEFESYQMAGSNPQLKQACCTGAPVVASNANGPMVVTPLGQFATADVATKVAGTPSMVSSGYGSQAVSSTTLSSDDSISIRSISVDETPDSESKQFREGEKPSCNHDGSNSSSSPDDDSSSKVTTVEEAVEKNHHHDHDDDGEAKPTENHVDIPKKQPSSATVVKKRDRGSASKWNATHRASYPAAVATTVSLSSVPTSGQAVIVVDQILVASNDNGRADSPLNSSEHNLSSDTNVEDNMSTSSSFGSRADLSKWSEATVPEWAVIGESVLIRPYNTSGVIAFIGNTEFAGGIWIGIDQDAPTGKNDGTVNGVRYFECRPRHGIFVRPDKLILDKRGRGMRSRSNGPNNAGSLLGHSRSKTAGLSASMVDVNLAAGLRHSQSREMLSSSPNQDGALRRSKSRGDVSNRNNNNK